MKSRIAIGLAVASLSVFGLSACSSDGGGSTTTPAAPASDVAMTPAPDDSGDTSGASLATADSALGTIVVDGDGVAVYQFDSDSKGGDSSTCTGQCATNWPAVPGADTGEFEGVTGTVGTITGVDGNPQLTLNGWPLYYYVGDTAAGQTSGQGVGGVWWVLTPAGDPITS